MVLNEIIRFAAPFWLINISLNLIYIAKLYWPAIQRIDIPLDGHRKFFDDHRLLGDSTTRLGIPVAMIAGIIIQLLLADGIAMGILSGLVVFFGHALGSFIKRRAGFSAGRFMPIVDHGDYIILAGLLFGLMQQFSWSVIGLGILLTYLVHPIVTYLSYLIKWHKYPL
jgi:CDP-archaeol synthase